jgi:hypothetical protein
MTDGLSRKGIQKMENVTHASSSICLFSSLYRESMTVSVSPTLSRSSHQIDLSIKKLPSKL